MDRHIDPWTGGETDRWQTERWTDRQTDRQKTWMDGMTDR